MEESQSREPLTKGAGTGSIRYGKREIQTSVPTPLPTFDNRTHNGTHINKQTVVNSKVRILLKESSFSVCLVYNIFLQQILSTREALILNSKLEQLSIY